MDEIFSVIPERLGDHSALVRQQQAIAGQIQELLRRAARFSKLNIPQAYSRASGLAEDLEHYFSETSRSLIEIEDLFLETSSRAEALWQDADETIRRLSD